MLISCPKCHSVYEVPDSLVPKTGQNFRCSACSNVWNVIKSDALGYNKDEEDEIVVEAIDVEVPPYRNYPADKEEYKIVNDTKPVKKKKIQAEEEVEIEEKEEPKSDLKAKNNELTLRSSQGTSFTISMGNGEDDEKSFFGAYDKNEAGVVKALSEDRVVVEKKKNWYFKTRCFIIFMFLLLGIVVFRNMVVLSYSGAEEYYNKIGLSGYDNYHNLEFLDVKVNNIKKDGKNFIEIKSEIKNNGVFASKVLDVTVSGLNKRFSPERKFLKGKEKTNVSILVPREDFLGEVFRIEFVKQ